ncbi:IS200/IS605 family transposase [Candidatus Saganbacteria bacterium]|nr:IS200/IS605 family transposase [Candidatus Saganbacteria bacterium]
MNAYLPRIYSQVEIRIEDMLYHYTFRTYKGLPLLEDKKLIGFLMNTFHEIGNEKGFKIVECEILCDHVHALIEHNYILSSSLVMKNLKGISARRLFQKYPTNRFDIRKLWGRSFHARKIGADEKDSVISYIIGQRDENGIDKRF